MFGPSETRDFDRAFTLLGALAGVGLLTLAAGAALLLGLVIRTFPLLCGP